jgi:hypothetical protein
MATSPESTAGSAARAHRALALLVLAGGIVQFVIAGYAAFGGSNWEAHETWGRILTVVALVVLILAAVGRRAALQSSAVLFGLLVLQNVLGMVGADAPAIGALHPLNGLLILLAAMLASAGRPVRFGPPHRPAAG